MTDHAFTHLDPLGRARMVDVTPKEPSHRRAIARGRVHMTPETASAVTQGAIKKGDVLAVARVAGIQAAKRCDALIPLCHTLPLDAVSIDFERAGPDRLRVTGTAIITARTGVEMEALTGVSVSLLTLWDMVKGIDADLRIDDVRLVEKRKEPTS